MHHVEDESFSGRVQFLFQLAKDLPEKQRQGVHQLIVKVIK